MLATDSQTLCSPYWFSPLFVDNNSCFELSLPPLSRLPHALPFFRVIWIRRCEKEALHFMANLRIFIKYCHTQQERCGPCSTPPSLTVSPGLFPLPHLPCFMPNTSTAFSAISLTEPVKYQSCKFLQKSDLAECHPRDYPTSKHLIVLAFPVAIHQEQAYFIGNKWVFSSAANSICCLWKYDSGIKLKRIA